VLLVNRHAVRRPRTSTMSGVSTAGNLPPFRRNWQMVLLFPGPVPAGRTAAAVDCCSIGKDARSGGKQRCSDRLLLAMGRHGGPLCHHLLPLQRWRQDGGPLRLPGRKHKATLARGCGEASRTALYLLVYRPPRAYAGLPGLPPRVVAREAGRHEVVAARSLRHPTGAWKEVEG